MELTISVDNIQTTTRKGLSRSCVLSFSMKWSWASSKIHEVSISWWEAKGLALNWGVLLASSHDCERPLWGWKCRVLRRDQQDWEEGKATGLCYRGNVMCPTSISMGMYQSSKTMPEPLVNVLSKVTCSVVEPWLFHGQWSPQACLQLNICRTSLQNMSRDSLTSHRTSMTLLIYLRNGARSPKQPLGSSSGAWGIVISCACQWMEALLTTDT